MKRPWFVALALSAAVGCHGSGTSPSTSPTTTYSVPLAASNEVPSVSNAEAGAGGTTTITLHATKDGSGNVTSATVDFQVTVTGLTAGSALTAAHIHQGGAGVAGSVLVDTGLTSGSVPLSGGSGSFSKTGVNVTADIAQGMLNNGANYYFNIHSTLNPDGVARGQLGPGKGSGGGGGGGGYLKPGSSPF